MLNRIEVASETMRQALNSLAVVAPGWLERQTHPDWIARYARRAEDDRLPTGQARREELACIIGRDGYTLLLAIYAADAPAWLRGVPAVDTLRRVWIQQYQLVEGGVQWRASEDIPSATTFISSPYDLDAHYAKKRTTQWVGYKVHITETCEDDLPHLVTQVETMAGPIADGDATPVIHQNLERRGLLPQTHLVDTGYLDAGLLVSSQQDFAVDLFGPTRPNRHWQARAGEGFDIQHFRVDWEQQQATCPEGRTSVSWTPAVDNRHTKVIKIKFSTKDCGRCPSRMRCVRSKNPQPRRTITVQPRASYEALQAARQREETTAFAAIYARRAGIEGTISREIRTSRLRRTRYIGLERTRLGHLLTAAALNFLRLGEWFMDVPRAKTRRSPFAKLMADCIAA
jgi:transposase